VGQCLSYKLSEETVEEIFKDYGSAIGPTVAFLLGIFALFIKNKVDICMERCRTLKKFRLLKELINESSPPSKYHPQKSDIGLIHADQARNITNIARFYNRLLTTRILIDNLEEDIFRHGEKSDIQQFNNIKWWHNILLKDIEKIRESSELDMNTFRELSQNYQLMKDACDNADQLFDYIE
jgi:hypothetical protein